MLRPLNQIKFSVLMEMEDYFLSLRKQEIGLRRNRLLSRIQQQAVFRMVANFTQQLTLIFSISHVQAWEELSPASLLMIVDGLTKIYCRQAMLEYLASQYAKLKYYIIILTFYIFSLHLCYYNNYFSIILTCHVAHKL